jgi:hypothetical protein
MHRLRALIFSLAAMAMIATGIGIGLAQGAMAAEGQLCSVTGPAQVVLAHDGLPLFDADGEPVTLDRSLCLDCLIAAFDLPPAAQGAPRSATVSTAQLRPNRFTWLPTRTARAGQARAPPLAV